MNNIYANERLALKVDDSKTNTNDKDKDFLKQYPLPMPRLFLDRTCYKNHSKNGLNWESDTTILVKDKSVWEYTQTNFSELLVEDQDGDIVWIDGREAPYSDDWDGQFLNEERPAQEYTILEYGLENSEKREYKISLEDTSPICELDCYRLTDFVEEEILKKQWIKLGYPQSPIQKKSFLL